MKSYIEREKELLLKVNNFNIKKEIFYNMLLLLNIGDIIYEHGIYDDYYPQEIKEIDLQNYRILTYEKSIKSTKWVYVFHIRDEKTGEFKFYC